MAKRCSNPKCKKKITDATAKTLMHNGLHRYVCSSQCMLDYYKVDE